MSSRVLSLPDYRQAEIPEEAREWKISEEEIEKRLQTLAENHASEWSAELVQEGDSVLCTDAGCPGEEVLLFPGRKLPGAEEAEQTVCGKKKGETFSCTIAGEERSLQVQEIRSRSRVEIDDALIESEQIEGVHTVDEYRSWYRETENVKRREKAMALTGYEYQDYCVEHAEYEIDEADMMAWTTKEAENFYEMYVSMGRDPRTMYGEPTLTEAEAKERFRQDMERRYWERVLAAYLAEKTGFEIDESAYLKTVDTIAEQQDMDRKEVLERFTHEIFAEQEMTRNMRTFFMNEAEKEMEE